MTINYQLEKDLSVEDFKQVLVLSKLGERRPIDNPDRLQAMLSNSQIIITARHNGKIVGVARAITDHAYCCYLSDLAVIEGYQKQGIGRKLIELTHGVAGDKTTLVLVSAPAAESYYPRIGLKPYPCFGIPRSS